MRVRDYWHVALLLVIIPAGCSSPKRYARQPLVTEENDRQSIAKPSFHRVSLFQDAVNNVFAREIGDALDLSHHLKNIGNDQKEATNTNALDEVINSTWFTNRHAANRMTSEELKSGPDLDSGPDMENTLTIVAAKAEGVSPGFRVKDVRGNQYYVKFDMKGFPDLNTAAEIISTKFVYACGYNTPENYLCYLKPDKLKIGEGVQIRNKWGRDVPMTTEFVEDILSRVEQRPDGTYRMVASKRLSGEAIGPFEYQGRRKDDPNDLVRHENRRELRGYRVIAAWLNNYDSKANNTLDMYVTEGDRRFVKHYIIDFASSLGSGGYGSASASRGIKGAFDGSHILMKTFTLGLHVEPHEKRPAMISPGVGYFDSDLFSPGDYAFIVPNPAFQRMTETDAFWGSKVVMSFSDQDIRDIVSTGDFSDPADAEYLARILIERRDKTGRYWFGKVNPLDRFRFQQQKDGKWYLGFDDLAVDAGFESADSTRYRFELTGRGNNQARTYYSSEPRLLFETDLVQAVERHRSKTAHLTEENKMVSLRITKGGKSGSNWNKPVNVFVYSPWPDGDPPEVIAIERER